MGLFGPNVAYLYPHHGLSLTVGPSAQYRPAAMSVEDERSRALGGLVCLATLVAGALFLYGLSAGSYWAIALPVAAVTLFVLTLVFWIGWTIATVQVESANEPSSGAGPSSATTADADDSSASGAA